MGYERVGKVDMNSTTIIIQDANTRKFIDISQLVVSLTWETQIGDQPGKLSFKYVDDGKTYFAEGSKIAVTDDNVGMFSGFIFTRDRTNDIAIEITAYDQMRYLQNKDIMNLPIMTANQVFEKICKEQKLIYKTIHASNYKIAGRLHDNKSYYEIMQTAIDETLAKSGQWYMIRDNFGVLEFVDLKKLLTPLIIGDNSLLMSYSFKSSIDEDTFNQIKITKDNKATAKRDVYVAKNNDTINRWGTLQYYESAKEDATDAQIEAKAVQLLALKNRPTRSLSLKCLGDKRVRAGNGIILSIDALKNEDLAENQSALVYSCSHTIEKDKHTMDLDVEIVGTV